VGDGRIEVGRCGGLADLATGYGADKPVRGRVRVLAGWPRGVNRPPVTAAAVQHPNPVTGILLGRTSGGSCQAAPAREHRGRPREGADVGDRVAVDDEQVGVIAGPQSPLPVP
jgi:hypothetical protein